MTQIFFKTTEIKATFAERESIRNQLLKYFQESNIKGFVRLVLGIDDPNANYSASEHGLGNRILSEVSPDTVYGFTQDLIECDTPHSLLANIYNANIPYLKISVGTEMAMMMRPELFWVANTRSVWAHLLVKHEYDYSKADQELALYRDQENTSEMGYMIWRDIYPTMNTNLRELGRKANEQSESEGYGAIGDAYLFCDTVANWLYNNLGAEA
jgi:hypothetical protein